jgi:hypothetical protein
MSGAWLTFRSHFVVTCPADRQPAGVIVDAWHAAATAVLTRPFTWSGVFMSDPGLVHT